MKRIERVLTAFGELHQNEPSRWIHLIVVPMLLFSLLGMLWTIPSSALRFALGTGPFNNWSTITMVLLMLFYMRFSVLVGLGVGVFGVLSLNLIYVAETEISLSIAQVSIGIFFISIVGWYNACRIGDKKISFQNSFRLLPGSPVWWMTTLYRSIC